MNKVVKNLVKNLVENAVISPEKAAANPAVITGVDIAAVSMIARRVAWLVMWFVVTGPLLLSAEAAGGKRLGAGEFIASCGDYLAEGPSSPGSTACSAYLEGYLAATDKVISEDEFPSTFMLRALRTRIPDESESIETLLSSPYCLPKEETVRDFIVKIAAVDRLFTPGASADDVVQAVLKKHYLCDR